ncbi:PepSY domain-containing protein [Caballeronia sp. LZ034LL]|uniref:PepSY-associated TM helix domain-containing protein n=1 Tax=Caballeronia sp. LZ034LL TaxID=3038567 RepID=UPI00285F8554|nr:PepSY domain-containing protein [Caballeronia sp. LZ034LL]MDR5833833.1 PepSY domain-containing protein [Caballeronia sp. LZ034LL]
MLAPDTSTAVPPAHSDVIAQRRTLWRWHFYAGLFVMPLLLVLAITGTIYCFQPQLEPLMYRDRMVVADPHVPPLPRDVLLARAAASEPRGAVATLAQIETDRTRSAEFAFRLPSGESESVYVNPYDGVVLGTLSVEHRLMKQVRDLHRGLMLGKTGELLMELAGCWTLVMIGTGVALWWPDRTNVRNGGVWLPRLSLRGRAWWRDLHAVGGVWLAAGALFFVLSGLPWSGSWGREFKALATSASLGYPKGAWGEAHVHSSVPAAGAQEADAHAVHSGHAEHAMPMTMADLPLKQTPWAVGATAVPDGMAAPVAAARLSLDQVVALAARNGVADDYGIALPNTPGGVYTVSSFPADPRDERTLHIDQYSDRVLADISYANYGRVAQWISYGTSLHMGRYFGLANQIVCSAISLGLAALALTGFVMWLKRRPARTIGAPARPARRPPMRAWRGGLTLLGMIFPLMGATMLAVWCVDRIAFGAKRAAA